MNYILGIGNFGILIHQILTLNGYNIDGFVDLNPESELNEFINLPVLKKDSISPQSTLYIASNRYNHAWIASQFKNFELKFADDVINFSDLNLDDYVNSSHLKWSSEKAIDVLEDYMLIRSSNNLSSQESTSVITLSSLDIVVTERCTLKCKDCSNLMQYYTHPQNSNIQEIISSITKILSNVRVKAIRLIGGEPLISKDLPEIIDFISNKYDDRYDAIQIYTNATIVPNNKLLNAAKASGRTSFYISDYKDLSRHKAEVVDLLKKHSIRFALESQLTWQDCGNIHPYDNTQINYKYSNCCVNKAFSIIGTKLYSCPFSANFHNIYAGESCSTRDCIELNEINDTEFKVAICDLLMNQTPLSACYFCKGRDYTVTEVPAAVQTREILTRS